MADLFTRQQELWQLLCSYAEKPPMLRLSRSDDCFWVCDLPRRESDPSAARAALARAGFAILPHTADGLWHIDLPPEDTLFCIQAKMPVLPQKQEQHTLYALCRLLLAHPAPLSRQPMDLVRALMKLTLLEPKETARQALRLYSLCAARLNRRQPLPAAACGLLVQTLQQEDNI